MSLRYSKIPKTLHSLFQTRNSLQYNLEKGTLFHMNKKILSKKKTLSETDYRHNKSNRFPKMESLKSNQTISTLHFLTFGKLMILYFVGEKILNWFGGKVLQRHTHTLHGQKDFTQQKYQIN